MNLVMDTSFVEYDCSLDLTTDIDAEVISELRYVENASKDCQPAQLSLSTFSRLTSSSLFSLSTAMGSSHMYHYEYRRRINGSIRPFLAT